MLGFRVGIVLALFQVSVLYSQQLQKDERLFCHEQINLSTAEVCSYRTAICVGCTVNDAAAVIDADLQNYATMQVGIGLLDGGTALSIKNNTKYYPAGYLAGFVVEPVGGLLSANVLSGIELRTYYYNSLMETATYGGVLKAKVLQCGGGKYRISFITTQPFNEIQLYIGGTVTLLSQMKVYYAYKGPGTCQRDCMQTIDGSLGASVNSGTNSALPFGLSCIGTSIQNTANVIDTDTTNYASLSSLIEVGCTQWISVKVNSDFSPGTSAGFLVDDSAGLLDVDLIDLIEISTYNDGLLQESKTGFQLVAASLLENSNKAIFGFQTTQAFDEIRISLLSGVGLVGTFRVYGALFQTDVDLDGIPDCIDGCPWNNCSSTASFD